MGIRIVRIDKKWLIIRDCVKCFVCIFVYESNGYIYVRKYVNYIM